MNRLLFWLLATAMVACGSGPVVDTDAGADAPAPQLTRTVAFTPGAPLQLEPGAQVALAVTVTDFNGVPQPDVDVRFALLGSVLDATINQSRVRTGSAGADLGVARAMLRAPSDSATIRVRASVAQAADAFLDVSVSGRGFGGISLTVAYAGNRQPARLEADLFTGVTCDQVASADAVRAVSLPATGAVVHFGPLAAGGTFALRVDAVGTDGTVLADGCVDQLVVMRDEDVAASVTFTDAPLQPSGTYACGMQLSLDTAVLIALPQWTAAISTAEAGATDDSAYLLDAIGDAVERRSGTAARAEYDRAIRAGLGAQVAADLAARGAGPTPVLGAIATDVGAVLADIDASMMLTMVPSGAGRAMLTANNFVASLDPGTPDVRADDGRVSLGGTGQGEITLGSNDRAVLTLRGLSLPVADLAVRAEGLLLVRLGVGSSGEWVRLVTDCGRIASQVSASTAGCDVACATAACDGALDHVATAFDSAIASVGSSYRGVSLRIDGVARTVPGTLALRDVPQAIVRGAYVDAAVVSFAGTAAVTPR